MRKAGPSCIVKETARADSLAVKAVYVTRTTQAGVMEAATEQPIIQRGTPTTSAIQPTAEEGAADTDTMEAEMARAVEEQDMGVQERQEVVAAAGEEGVVPTALRI